MKKVAIIDDEQDARQSLKILIDTFCPDIEICGEAYSVESAFTLIRQINPQIILLDISMEDGTGFDLLDKFPNPLFQVIFVTAHDEFALKAFRYHALDYLLKPINPTELVQTLDKVTHEITKDFQLKISHLLESTQTKRINKISLTSLEGIIYLSLDHIVRLESDGSYTTFYTLNNERHLITRPMKDFEDLFVSEGFFRLHQSHMVNLNHVNKMIKEDGGYVLMEDGAKIPIARRRKDEFLEVMKQRFKI